ncbi:MAG TPA: PAS domain S-box protein [Terracidiphilus sp.]|nr:PAS domain S-box protein [Terracidiphilus sp.]
MQEHEYETRELRRLLRDLVALSSTPAMWVGRELPHIADGFADMLLHTLGADAVYVALYSGGLIEGIRAGKHPGFKAEVERLRKRAHSQGFAVESAVLSSWPSQLRVALYPIGLAKDDGFVAVGSSDPNFPSETESLLLSVAANQAAVAVQAARLRMKAEMERQRFAELVAEAPAAIGVLQGPEHRWAYVNKHYVRVTGRRNASDFIGKTIGESLPEIMTQQFLELLDQVYGSGRPYFGCEVKASLNRGHAGQPEEVYFDFVYQPIRSAEGEVEGILVHAVEVTEKVLARRKIESALVASQRLAAIVDSSYDAIASKDLNGIVTSWNPAAEKIFGFTAEEMIGRSIRCLIPPELQEDEDRILATIARGERIDHFETVRLTKSGERIDVSLTVSPVKDEAGRIVGAAKIARDITERKKTEQALRTTERLAAVGRLAATVAHEINNPLEAVTNLIYLAKAGAVREEIREFLARAEEEIERISQLTKQTLGFYRETKTATAVKVGDLLNPLMMVFASRLRNKGAEIYPEILEHPEIKAIPGEIRQLLANLLSNSIDAVQEGGRIHIRVSRGDARNGEQRSGVRITVADSGSGISSAAREHIFEPFFTTKKDVGTGLGLWVCKNIVENHQGSLRLKSSTKPGKSWTVVSIFLPSFEEDAVRKVVTQASPVLCEVESAAS